MTLSITVSLIAVLVGQAASAAAGTAPRDAGERLEFMKKSLAVYDIRALDEQGTACRLQELPVLRFRNPVSQSKDGAIFLWLGEGDRPEVAVQVYCNSGGAWLQEFSSLAVSPLIAKSAGKPDWSPSRAGVEFKPVPGAPTPGKTAEERRRQMAALAGDFVAEKVGRQTSDTLRLLTKPLARYGKPVSSVSDGSLYCFAFTTDPEVFLMLEARQGQGGGGLEWQYAFAPSTTQPVRCSWAHKEVWSLPNRTQTARQSPNEAFHVRQFATEVSGDLLESN